MGCRRRKQKVRSADFLQCICMPCEIVREARPRDAEPTTDFCIAHRGLMEQTGNVGIFAPVFLFVHHCSATNVNELLRETHYPPLVIFPLLLRNVPYRTFAEDVRFSFPRGEARAYLRGGNPPALREGFSGAERNRASESSFGASNRCAGVLSEHKGWDQDFPLQGRRRLSS